MIKLNREKILKLVYSPNFLTLFRIATAPVLIILLLFPTKIFSFLAAILFSIAAITDYFDGFWARRSGLVSNFGKVMDPLADKILISTSMIMLVSLNRIPAWFACVIIGRELAITALRSLVAESGGDVSASFLGKYKTGFQIAAIIPLFIHYHYFGVNLHIIGMFFLWCALIMTIWSGISYLIKFKNVLMS
jgi:CDP-diacylglycerol---glycerol-3-phosphate 3-phosphatidyltransferase